MNKSAFRFFYAFVLLIIFSMRVTLPLLIHFSDSREEAITQQEDGNQEKSPEKSIQENGKEALLLQHFAMPVADITSRILFGHAHQPALPVQYSSIPTPPPWVKS